VAVSVRVPARDWSLSRESFERMLGCLDADRERAAELYERIRARLRKLFRWRGVVDPDPLVDDVFDRVARRLEQGLQLTTRDPYSLFHGVALNVLQEHWRRPSPPAPLTDSVRAIEPPDPAELAARERRFESLADCLARLPADSRRLLEEYHRDGSGRIRARRVLAQALGVSAATLRLRAFRIRASLLACIEDNERTKR
jgi:DNA-directed RNA polymerase specialized sigma24 family protein